MDQDMPEQNRLSRRGLVKAAVGTATVGAVAIGSARTQAMADNASNGAPQAEPAGHDVALDAGPATAGDLLVHVRDARTGDLDVYVGDRQLTVRDRALAARLTALGH